MLIDNTDKHKLEELSSNDSMNDGAIDWLEKEQNFLYDGEMSD